MIAITHAQVWNSRAFARLPGTHFRRLSDGHSCSRLSHGESGGNPGQPELPADSKPSAEPSTTRSKPVAAGARKQCDYGFERRRTRSRGGKSSKRNETGTPALSTPNFRARFIARGHFLVHCHPDNSPTRHGRSSGARGDIGRTSLTSEACTAGRMRQERTPPPPGKRLSEPAAAERSRALNTAAGQPVPYRSAAPRGFHRRETSVS